MKPNYIILLITKCLVFFHLSNVWAADACLDSFYLQKTVRPEVQPWSDVSVEGVTYWHSNRTLQDLRTESYLNGELDSARLKTRKVLDLPAGDGRAVMELRNEGVDVIGVDYAFSKQAKGNPFLVLGNWNRLPFFSDYFNTTMMNNGIFLYSHNYSDKELSLALQEAIRVTSKSNGEILITGVSEPSRLEKIAKENGLLLKSHYQSKDGYTAPDSTWTYHFLLP